MSSAPPQPEHRRGGRVGRYWLHALTLVIVAYSLGHVIRNIDAPFYAGHHMTGHNALQGTANENFRQHGYLKMRFGVSGYRKDERCGKAYYINHPVLGVVLASIPARIIGNDEWVIRGTQLVLYLVNLLLLFLIGRALLGDPYGLFAVMVYALLPVDRIYSILPAYHGTMFYTFSLLIVYLTVRHARGGKPIHAVAAFLLYLLSLLHEWTCVVNLFTLAAYSIAFRRQHLYKDFFFLLLLSNLGAFLNFLHASILLGHVAVNEPFTAFVPRAGGLGETIDHLPFLFYLFRLAFGAAALSAAAIGIWAFARLRDRLSVVVVLGQVAACVLYIVLFKGALYVHWYLFMIFSLLVTLLVCYALKRFARHTAVALAVVALILFESRLSMGRYERDELNEGYPDAPLVESMTRFRRTWELSDRFLKARAMDNETLVLYRGPIFFLSDYYLGREGYCFDVPPANVADYRGYPAFRRAVYLRIDDRDNLVIDQVRPRSRRGRSRTILVPPPGGPGEAQGSGLGEGARHSR